MSSASRPPRLSRWVLAQAARSLALPELAADAEDVYRSVEGRKGRVAARRWYRRETRRALWRCAVPVTTRLALPSPAGISLDARLGFRMLRRYPGLTLVGGFAMAFAIFVGAGLFEFIRQTLPGPQLPIPHGEQVIGIRLYDKAENRPQLLSPDQLRFLHASLVRVDLLSGLASSTLNVETRHGTFGSYSVARMSPQGFVIAGARAALGRVFDEDDLRLGADVVVVGHQAALNLFGDAANALGQRLQIGDAWFTVIGVMPEGFRFPLSHGLWIPLDLNAPDTTTLRVFGRMQPGTALSVVQQQLDVLSASLPLRQGTRAQTTLLAQSYRESWFDTPVTLLRRVIVQQLNLFAALFLSLVAANIALLMFARAATRERELVVRSALGAGRRRIVTQFLIEALALFGIATTLGLLATGPGLAWVERRIGDMGGGTSPFWFSPSVSIDTVVYAAVLTIAAALMSGGIPALRATRQLKASRIHETGGGAGRLRLGGIWTVVVVTQVAATVVFTAGTLLMWRQARAAGALDANFPAAAYVAMQVAVADDVESAAAASGLHVLTDRLRDLPGVTKVTVASRLPLMAQNTATFEVEGIDGYINVAAPLVQPGYFDAFGAPLVTGRSFTDADATSGAPVVVVDEAFADHALGGRQAAGRRVRLAAAESGGEPGPWLEISGVVRNLEEPSSGTLRLDNSVRASVFRPLQVSELPRRMHVAVHVARPDAAQLQSIRRIAAHAPGALIVEDVQTLDRVVRAESAFWQLWAELLMITATVALLLALAGIYAVMSFTVTRRTREIGVRMALGAPGTRVTWEVLRGQIREVLWGVAIGCVVVAAIYWTATGHVESVEFVLLLAFGAVLTLICATACLGPARRALLVQPARALGTNE